MASMVLYVAVACCLTATTLAVDVPFTSCSTGGAVSPSSVSVNCSSVVRGMCVMVKGATYSVQAHFTPERESRDVESSVAWKTWVEMPLTGQNRNACTSRQVSCPLSTNSIATLTYPLHVPTYWMRRRYPLVFRLTDRATNLPVLCFNLRVQIVSRA